MYRMIIDILKFSISFYHLNIGCLLLAKVGLVIESMRLNGKTDISK